MCKKTLLFLLFLSAITYGQKTNLKNLSIEGAYGFTGFKDSHHNEENILSLGHLDVGVKWMCGKVWGIKFDIGKDKTIVNFNGIESGCDYTRFSLQTVCNLTYLVHTENDKEFLPMFNLIAHFGGGYSFQTSTLVEGTDKMGNIVFGLNPKIRITKDINLGVDFTGVINFSRHFDYDGRKITNGTSISETGFIYNASINLNYTFWRQLNKKF